jgi:pimeloyl-ACP methyl ester carboxylesterase
VRGRRRTGPYHCSVTEVTDSSGSYLTSLPWLHRMPHPALLVAGEKDPSVPLRNARVLAARLPNARLHIVKGGGR